MSRSTSAAICVLILAGAFVAALVLGPARAPYDLDDCMRAYARARTATDSAAVSNHAFPGRNADTSRTCGALLAAPVIDTQPRDSVVRKVHYVRHDFHSEDDERDGTLLELMYDIPYVGACGIFPPLHLLNAQLLDGGGDGGMGPGASWKPFSLTPQAYARLVAEIRTTPVSAVHGPRYVHEAFAFDSTFDHIADHLEWIRAVCAKHRPRG
jgi:hypothetical protein